MKDDSDSHAVFTEQGSSASQITAAKIMDIISRLPACAGQAADAVSAYTQVKMEEAPKLLKIPKSECPDTGIRLPRGITLFLRKTSRESINLESLTWIIPRIRSVRAANLEG